MKIRTLAAALCIVATMATAARADFSSMTPAERATIAAALSQAWEYRALLDGKDRGEIVAAVQIDSTHWKITVALSVPKQDGSAPRVIERDVFLEIKKAPAESRLAFAVGGFCVGLAVGAVIVAIVKK